MSFSGPVPELEIVQEEKETRSDANALSKKLKKRSFTILKQKEVIEIQNLIIHHLLHLYIDYFNYIIFI